MDAILLAGQGDDKQKLTIDGKRVSKQSLGLGGKFLFEWPLEALVEAESVDRVFVVGSGPELGQVILGKYAPLVNQGKVVPIPDQGSLMQNVGISYFVDHLTRINNLETPLPELVKRARIFQANNKLHSNMVQRTPALRDDKKLIVPYDMACLTAEQVDHFIQELVDPTADIEIGLGDVGLGKKKFKEDLDLKLFDNDHKLSGSYSDGQLIRLGLITASYFAAPPTINSLIEHMYRNRHMKDGTGDGSFKLGKSLKFTQGILMAGTKYLKSLPKYSPELGKESLTLRALQLCLFFTNQKKTELTGGIILGPDGLRRTLPSRAVIEDVATYFAGGATVKFAYSDNPLMLGPVIDVDCVRTYQDLVANDNHARIRNYLKKVA